MRYTQIDSLTFSSNTTILTVATLSTARYDSGGVSSGTRGYAAGGISSTAIYAIDGITFANHTAFLLGVTIQGGYSGTSGFYSSNTGFFTNGATAYTNISQLQFSNETTSLTSAQLAYNRYNAACSSEGAWLVI